MPRKEMKRGRTFYFIVEIRRAGVPIVREGGLTQDNVKLALEEIADMADEWQAVLEKTQLYAITKDGELGDCLATIYHQGRHIPSNSYVPKDDVKPKWKNEVDTREQLWSHGVVFKPTTTFNTMIPKEK